MAEKECCPECGKHEGVPLVWGKPRGEAVEKVANQQWVCGGCDIWSALDGGVMDRSCLACGAQWNSRSPSL